MLIGRIPIISQNIMVLSAYMIILNISVHVGKSLMYTEKKGPKTKPCGTPVLISSVSDVEPLKSTT